jgi:hypothetical protein
MMQPSLIPLNMNMQRPRRLVYANHIDIVNVSRHQTLQHISRSLEEESADKSRLDSKKSCCQYSSLVVYLVPSLMFDGRGDKPALFCENHGFAQSTPDQDLVATHAYWSVARLAQVLFIRVSFQVSTCRPHLGFRWQSSTSFRHWIFFHKHNNAHPASCLICSCKTDAAHTIQHHFPYAEVSILS